jgi:chemotaxis protein MotA
MDILSILGIVIGISSILVGNILEGGSAGSLVNGPAALIVVGGTVGAALLQTPRHHLLPALKMLRWIFQPPRNDFEQTKIKIVSWATVARREGLLGLENISDSEKDGFSRQGLQMVVDGSEPHAIRQTLETTLFLQQQRNLGGAHFYEAMGGYAPTIGIVGAVLGLIQVMTHLADPAALGGGIAVAFVATVYGVGFANLLLLPIANKLKAVIGDEQAFYEMVMEGIVSIADGEHPRAVQLKMSGFIV